MMDEWLDKNMFHQSTNDVQSAQSQNYDYFNCASNSCIATEASEGETSLSNITHHPSYVLH